MREPFGNGRDLLRRSQYEYGSRGTRMAPVPQLRVTGTASDVSYLRVWACLAYALDPATKRKLDLTGSRYIFVSCTDSLQQHKLMDSSSHISVG